MSSKSEHKRILLNKNSCGKVEFCEDCDVVEIEMGPVSVRFHAQDLETFNDLIHEAKMRLTFYSKEKEYFGVSMLGEEGIH